MLYFIILSTECKPLTRTIYHQHWLLIHFQVIYLWLKPSYLFHLMQLSEDQWYPCLDVWKHYNMWITVCVSLTEPELTQTSGRSHGQCQTSPCQRRTDRPGWPAVAPAPTVCGRSVHQAELRHHAWFPVHCPTLDHYLQLSWLCLVTTSELPSRIILRSCLRSKTLKRYFIMHLDCWCWYWSSQFI